jgi:hypothetical protein
VLICIDCTIETIKFFNRYSFYEFCTTIYAPIHMILKNEHRSFVILWIKWKTNKYHTVGTIPKSNIKIVKRSKIDITNRQIHDGPCSWFGTDTSIKGGWIKLVLCAQTSSLSEMMPSCTCFPHVSKMPTLTYNRANSVIIKNAIILNIIQNIFKLRDT